MAICLDLEAAQVLIMLYSCMIRNIAGSGTSVSLLHLKSKEVRYFLRDSLAYEPRPKRI